MENAKGCRNLIFVIVVIILSIIMIALMGCSATVPVQFENQLIITKKYSGKAMDCLYTGSYTIVITDLTIVNLCGDVDIPYLSHCYIRTIPCYRDVHPDIAKNLESKYLSFNGQEYRVKTW